MDENRKETANRTAEDAARQAFPNAPPQTDGDDIYHTKYIDFKGSAYDPRGMEQWLSERAAEGERVLVAVNAEGEPFDAHFDAGAGRAVDLVTGRPHDFGGGSRLAPYSAAYWRVE